jgi:hypothetical protein
MTEAEQLKGRILAIMLGHQFGRLKVVGAAKGDEKWFCRCDCGNAIDVEEKHLIGSPRRVACGECGPSVEPPPWRPASASFTLPVVD